MSSSAVALHIVSEYFGPIALKIAEILIDKASLYLGELKSLTRLSETD